MLYLILAMIVIIVLLAAFVWVIAVRSQTPSRKLIDTEPEPPFEKVAWISDGQPIAGWFIPPKQTNTPARAPGIVIAHGWSSSRNSALRYVSRLHDAGYALLLYDARGHGESGSVTAASGVTLRDDLRAAIDFLTERPEIDRKRIGVLGHSLGAFGSVLALGVGEQRIRALVTDAMPSRVNTMIAAELKRYKLPRFPLAQLIPYVWMLRTRIPRSQYDPVRAIDHSTAPVLMIHSRGDDYVPWTELDHVLSHIGRKVKHLYLNNKGHSSAWTEAEFWSSVLPFFQKHLIDIPNQEEASLAPDLIRI